MAVCLFEMIAILAFWRLADKSRLRELLPVMITASFIRFFEHFFVIDWFKIWDMHGPLWRMIWLPISADVTIWPTAAYLYIQYISENKYRRLLDTALWSFLMMSYLQLLQWLHVFKMEKGWKIYHSFFVIFGIFWIIYHVWRWLRQTPGGAGQHE